MIAPRDFSHLLGSLTGISDRMLDEHLGLYRGYVESLNAMEASYPLLDWTQPRATYAPHSELLRRESYVWNAVVLHELYFENLRPGSAGPGEKLTGLAVEAFKSFESYLLDLRAIAGSTHGWALTVWDPRRLRVANVLVEDHRTGPLAGCPVLLAIDCWEHAYAMDYGTRKDVYLGAVFRNIDWDAVESRLSAVLP